MPVLLGKNHAGEIEQDAGEEACEASQPCTCHEPEQRAWSRTLAHTNVTTSPAPAILY